jgi:hypothetical protein
MEKEARARLAKGFGDAVEIHLIADQLQEKIMHAPLPPRFASFLVYLFCLMFAVAVQAQTTERISAGGYPAWGNSESYYPALSANGRYVAFESTATNYVTGDVNGKADVFVYDRNTRQTRIVSINTNGVQGNDDSGFIPSDAPSFFPHTDYGLDISADGRVVAFSSKASNLVEGDTNNTWDIFVHDLATRQTTRVSIQSSGVQGNGDSLFPSLSADGRYICFVSFASNLINNDTNGRADVFVHDRVTGQTRRVSVSSAGEQGNQASGYVWVEAVDPVAPDISADGRYVAFVSAATNFDPFTHASVYVHDRVTGITAPVSISNDGSGGGGYGSSISDDGRYVCFASSAALVPEDTNNTWDVFVHDRLLRYTTRVSISDTGEQGNFPSGNITFFGNPTTGGPRISGNGKFIVYSSVASNLVPGDTNQRSDLFLYNQDLRQTRRINVPADGSQPLATRDTLTGVLSSDGRYAAFSSDDWSLIPGDGNGGWADVLIRDNTQGVLDHVSGTLESTWPSSTPSLSTDGRFVAFSSQATNLVENDTNGYEDVFVYDRRLHKTERVSVSSNGEQANSTSGYGVFRSYGGVTISPDGRYVAFQSTASNLVPGDTNGKMDAFVHDRATGRTIRVSVNSNGDQTQTGTSYTNFAFSPDNRFLFFSSDAADLVAGDTNGASDIFVHDLQSRQIQRLSVNAQGEQGNKRSYVSVCSTNGRYLAFLSLASNLMAGDTNGKMDVFVRDNTTGQIQCVSVNSQGEQGNGDCGYINLGISADGRLITFSSFASNLVENDTNGVDDVFVHDRLTGQTTRVSVSNSGEQADKRSGSLGLAMSSDGRYIAYYSEATNIVTPPTSGQGNVYLYDRLTEQTQLCGVNDAGEEGPGSGYLGMHLSADGRYVAFQSAASNLVPDDFNQKVDIFVRGPLYTGYGMAGTLELEGRAPSASSQPITFEFRTQEGNFLFFRTAEVGAGGHYSIEGIQMGDYQVHISGPRYLATNVNVHVDDNVSGLDALLHTGDANGDNACDVLDLDVLIRTFDMTPEQLQGESGADFNADESVDVLDLDLLIRNFDRLGDG